MYRSPESGEWGSRMTDAWVAVSYGALDVHGWGDAPTGVDIMLLPVYPVDEPIGLVGQPAALWHRLINDPVNDSELSVREREIVREFEIVGMASRKLDHAARLRKLPRPWLSSPQHELVYSLLGNVARANGIDAVFIKGPMLRKQGLRTREHSGDVDIWVDPKQILRLAKLVQRWGWSEHQGLWTGIPTAHSITLQRGSWGCEIDLHRHFPGFAMEELPLFILMAQQTEPATFAGTAVKVPEKGVHALVQALHIARPTMAGWKSERSFSDAVASLVAGGTSAHQFAVEARALAALSEVAAHAWPELPCRVPYAAPKNWTWRERTTTAGKLRSAFSMVPCRYRALYVRRILWPAAEEVKMSDLRAGNAGQSGIRARFRRLIRSLKASN